MGEFGGIRRWGGRGGWRSGRSRGACGQVVTGVRRGAWATRRDSGAVAMRVVDPGWSRWYDMTRRVPEGTWPRNASAQGENSGDDVGDWDDNAMCPGLRERLISHTPQLGRIVAVLWRGGK